MWVIVVAWWNYWMCIIVHKLYIMWGYNLRSFKTCDICIRPYILYNQWSDKNICKNCFRIEVRKSENKLIEYFDKIYKDDSILND